MTLSWPPNSWVHPVLLIALGAILLVERLRRGRCALPGYFGYSWAFLLVCVVSDLVSFTAAVWLMAVISFRALREYFSLVEMRLEDRWAILGSYLSIPFMIYLIQIDWYGFFIVSIPVYAFIVIPFLVALGDREGEGTLFSIGAIDFGLFFFVYCLGHLAYLAVFSTRLMLLLILAVVASNAALTVIGRMGWIPGYLLSCLLSLAVTWGLGGWTDVPPVHGIVLGFLIPALVCMSDYTVGVLEKDLGISDADLEPGCGRILDSLKSYLFAAPIVFHYLRWFMKLDEIPLGHGL